MIANFDGGAITSDAGALLLGFTDRAIGLTGLLTSCFTDRRRPKFVEHSVATLVTQRVFGLALGYEDLNYHDHLRHDPVMAVLAGSCFNARRLRADRRQIDPEPDRTVASGGTRYHKISHDAAAIGSCSPTCSSRRIAGRRRRW